MAQVAGKGGRVAFSRTAPQQILDLDEWSIDDSVGVIMTKSFEGLGRTAADAAFLDTSIHLKGYFSHAAGANPVQDAGLQAGNQLLDLFLYVSKGALPTDGLHFCFPNVLVLTSKCDLKADGRVDVDCTLVPTTDFFWPGDTVTLLALTEDYVALAAASVPSPPPEVPKKGRKHE